MSDEGFSSESDDVDYVPSGGEGASEEDESGEEENFLQDGADNTNSNRTRKKLKKDAEIEKRKRRGGIKLEGEVAEEKNAEQEEEDHSKVLAEEMKKEKEEKKDEQEKKHADNLWASFMMDVGGPAKSKPKTTPSSALGSLTSAAKSSSSTSSHSTNTSRPTVNKVTITKEFDFAGETIKVTKEVDANSKEAKQIDKMEETKNSSSVTKSGIPSVLSGLKRPAGGGLSSVLGKIGKKEKISTLNKSKIDWDSFKQKEGIKDELQIHNRGKEGFIERQAFLNRTDQRQFEIERDIRLGMSSKR